MTSRRLGVRGRAAVGAAGVVAIALAVGGWAVLTILRTNLEDNLDAALTQQSADRVALLESGSAPADLVAVQQDEAFAWIGRPDGTELAVGGSLRPVDPPLVVDPGAIATVRLPVDELKGEGRVEREDHHLRVTAAATRDGGQVIVLAAELESVDKAVGVVRSLMLTGAPLLVLMVAGLAWRSAGRALAPVESIRSRAARISGDNIDDRVPVPGGRDEIHDLAETMNDMLDRLDEHQSSIKRFTADAGHELKSPMANIRALTETADPSSDDWADRRDRLVAEADRVAALVDDLLFLAARDESAAPLRRDDSVHLDDLLFDEAERLAATHTVAVDISGVTPVPVRGDAVLLDRLIRNLADNAARHADSTVTFALRAHGDRAVLTVADDGPGIPVADRTVIFDRFHRVEPDRGRASGGTGLGLAIARGIAEDHDGMIEAGEGPEGGAVLTVRLPQLDRGDQTG